MDSNDIESILQRHPLSAFSFYTEVQARTLIDIGHRILNSLDNGIHEDCFEGDFSNDVYGLFWLWVLGAYEVVRTLSQHKDCFSTSAQCRIHSVKQLLHKIRVPFAKQELAGGKRNKVRYVYGELSVSRFDRTKKDFGYDVGGHIFWIRPTVREFEKFVNSVNRSDVIHALPTGDRA